MGDLFAASS
ncbi:hypothetical protein D018_0750A, partial [Vibrio parahaemolyticus VP2007-007]